MLLAMGSPMALSILFAALIVVDSTKEVSMKVFPSTLWTSDLENPQNTAGGLLTVSKVTPAIYDNLPETSVLEIAPNEKIRVSDRKQSAAAIEWPELTPFGINLVFCSCRSYHHVLREEAARSVKSKSTYKKYTEPNNLLWRGSTGAVTLKLPGEGWWHSIEWIPIWRSEKKSCGCGAALVTSYVGTSGHWYDASVNAIFKDRNAVNQTLEEFPTVLNSSMEYRRGHSSIFVSPMRVNGSESRLKEVPIPMSSPLPPPLDTHFILIDHSPVAGSSPSCLKLSEDQSMRTEEWVTVWGAVRSLIDLPVAIHRQGNSSDSTVKIRGNSDMREAGRPIKKRKIGPNGSHPDIDQQPGATDSNTEEFSRESVGSTEEPIFIRFYDASGWTLEPISRSSSSVNFSISRRNVLFCLMVWVGRATSNALPPRTNAPSIRIKLVAWQDWKATVSAPIFVNPSRYITQRQWSKNIRRVILRDAYYLETRNEEIEKILRLQKAESLSLVKVAGSLLLLMVLVVAAILTLRRYKKL
uniref:Wsv446-like protein n=1 Tax=Trachysalambria curvirostris nimavirus TaxID=2984282 RepID=A0A9C7F778_9VIRU|nr:MAG: wsv446-like protein [Trachysalambria curvirostris nimavirus]